MLNLEKEKEKEKKAPNRTRIDNLLYTTFIGLIIKIKNKNKKNFLILVKKFFSKK